MEQPTAPQPAEVPVASKRTGITPYYLEGLVKILLISSFLLLFIVGLSLSTSEFYEPDVDAYESPKIYYKITFYFILGLLLLIYAIFGFVVLFASKNFGKQHYLYALLINLGLLIVSATKVTMD